MLQSFKSLRTYNRLQNDLKVKSIDHIAYRIINHPDLKKKLPVQGMKQKEEYYFDNIFVKSQWYKTELEYKRVFQSELNLEEFMKKHKSLGEELKYYMINRYHGVHVKDLVTFKKYKEIYDVSQFAAWVLIHTDSINHVAIQVPDITICEELRQKDYQFHENNLSIYNISEDKKILQFKRITNLKL